MNRFSYKMITGLIATMLTITASAQQIYVSLQYVDPLQKVFKESAFFPDLPAVSNVARGEHATFQFAFRSNVDVKDLHAIVRSNASEHHFIQQNASIGYVGYVGVGRTISNPAVDRLTSPSGLYPDPILDTAPVFLPPDCTQPIWVDINIPKNIKPGEYPAKLIVEGIALHKRFSKEIPFKIHVYPVTIDSTSLWVTNWYNTDSLALSLMNDNKPVKPFSEKYWGLLDVIAKKMAAYCQNVVMISPLQLTQYTVSNQKYTFDFSRFDKTVQIFKKAGALKRIEGGHIGGRMGNWDSNFGVFVPEMKEDKTVFDNYPMTDSIAQNFYAQFIPALVNHLKEKGWYNIYLQHIADEPTDENYQSYIDIATFIKKLAPNIKLIEACHTHKLNDVLDIWVPELDFLAKDYSFYQQRQQAGNEVWFYTCLAPQGNFANRFIRLPLIKTRLLHWINFRYGITGYLHWGFNQWHNIHPFEETTGINMESGNVLPGGDSYIVYPGYGKLYSSVRLETMRDGIDDYQLLKMLAQKYPDKAKELCREVVYRFDWYDTNIMAFRKKHQEILELLSQ